MKKLATHDKAANCIPQPPGRGRQLLRRLHLVGLGALAAYWLVARWLLIGVAALAADGAQAEIRAAFRSGALTPIRLNDTFLLRFLAPHAILYGLAILSGVFLAVLARSANRRFRAAQRESRRRRQGLAAIRQATPLYVLEPVRSVRPLEHLGLVLAPAPYQTRAADASALEVLAAQGASWVNGHERAPASPLGIVILGPDGSGKTRILLELLRKMPRHRFLRWPSQLEAPPVFDPSLLGGQYVVLWLDDLSRWANAADADLLCLLPRQLVDAGAYPVVLASCRTGIDEAVARRYLHPLLSLLTELRLDTADAVTGVAALPSYVEIAEKLSPAAQRVLDTMRVLARWNLRTYPDRVLRQGLSHAGAITDDSTWLPVREELLATGMLIPAAGLQGIEPVSGIELAELTPLTDPAGVAAERDILTYLAGTHSQAQGWSIVLASLQAEFGNRAAALNMLASGENAVLSEHFMLQAELLAQITRFAEAHAVLDRALSTRGGSPTAVLARARLFLQQRRIDEARHDLDTLRTMWPTDDVPAALDCYALQLAGDLSRAHSELRQARAKLPSSPLLAIREADILRSEQRTSEAIELASRIVAARPGDRAVMLTAADLLATLDGSLLQTAHDAYTHVLNLAHGADPRAHLGLARLALRSVPEDLTVAERHLRMAIALGGELEAQARSEYARLLGRQHRIQEAETELRSATGLAPESPELQMALAQVLFTTGQLLEAEAHIRRALHDWHDNSEAEALLGDILLRKGQAFWEDARQVLTKALADDRNGITDASRALGELCLRMGDLDMALPLLRNAMQASPQAEIQTLYAYALTLSGRSDEAIQVLMGLPPSSERGLLVGFLEVQRGDLAGARAILLGILEGSRNTEARFTALVALTALESGSENSATGTDWLNEVRQIAASRGAETASTQPLATSLALVVAKAEIREAAQAVEVARAIFTTHATLDGLDRFVIECYVPLISLLRQSHNAHHDLDELLLILDSAASRAGAL